MFVTLAPILSRPFCLLTLNVGFLYNQKLLQLDMCVNKRDITICLERLYKDMCSQPCQGVSDTHTDSIRKYTFEIVSLYEPSGFLAESKRRAQFFLLAEHKTEIQDPDVKVCRKCTTSHNPA